MTEQSASFHPTILIDFKKGRIRVHKSAIHVLGGCASFRFLVNPANRVIAIQTCDTSDVRAHRILPFGENEVYSRALLRQLLLCGSWCDNSIYRLSGTLLPEEGTAFFKFEDAVRILPELKNGKG